MKVSEITDGQPVAVIGAGLVGAGWAIVFARAGLQARMYDHSPEVLERAPALVKQQLQKLEAYDLLTESAADVWARISTVEDLQRALDGAAYAQESVLEQVGVKRQLMEQIDRLGFDSLIIGSSTSGFPASDFALDLSISPRVLVAHPVNPPYLVPIVELVGSPQTSRETIDWTDRLMQAVGQSVVRVNQEIEGFILNRLQAVLLREAWTLAADGIASVDDIDKTIRDGLGWRWSFMGPFETIDLNAPDGIADYAQRFGPLFHRIAASRDQGRAWDEPLIRDVEAQRRENLSASDLNLRRAWRDEQLMRFAVHRKSATEG